jgi:hypothetical protein
MTSPIGTAKLEVVLRAHSAWMLPPIISYVVLNLSNYATQHPLIITV